MNATKLLRVGVAAAALPVLLASCVTINIYFPAAAAEKAADKIIDEVWRLDPNRQPPADKPGTITRLCGFVGQTATPEYLERCAAMVYDSPNKRRHTGEWSDHNKSLVERRVESEQYREALCGYEY